jgi:AcrR family transcriptional regulator
LENRKKKPDSAPPTPRKEAYHHGDLRQTLIDAARRLIEDKGPDGFSVAEAARAAGVSTAAPYRHFKDRTALLAAVALDGKLRLAKDFDSASAPFVPGSLDAISAIGGAYVLFATRQPGLFRLMFAGVDSTSEELIEAGERCFGHLLGHLAVRTGQAPEADMVRQLGFPLWTFVHGAAFLSIDGMLDVVAGGPQADAMIRDVTARLLGPSDLDG